MVNKYFKGRLMDKLSSEQLFRQKLCWYLLDLVSGAAKRSKSSKKGKRRLSSRDTPKHPRLLRGEGKVLLFLYLGKGWYCIACI